MMTFSIGFISGLIVMRIVAIFMIGKAVKRHIFAGDAFMERIAKHCGNKMKLPLRVAEDQPRPLRETLVADASNRIVAIFPRATDIDYSDGL